MPLPPETETDDELKSGLNFFANELQLFVRNRNHVCILIEDIEIELRFADYGGIDTYIAQREINNLERLIDRLEDAKADIQEALEQYEREKKEKQNNKNKPDLHVVS